MSHDDQRNTVIVGLWHRDGTEGLQGKTDNQLIAQCMEWTLGDCLVDHNWRSADDIQSMSHDDQRNTVIVELHHRDGTDGLQGKSDAQLIIQCMSTTLGDCLVEHSWRSATDILTMSHDDQRNTVIVALHHRDGTHGLQGKTDEQLISQCMAPTLGDCLVDHSWRSADSIGTMSHDDQRNTVIVELWNRDGTDGLQGKTDEELINQCFESETL